MFGVGCYKRIRDRLEDCIDILNHYKKGDQPCREDIDFKNSLLDRIAIVNDRIDELERWEYSPENCVCENEWKDETC